FSKVDRLARPHDPGSDLHRRLLDVNCDGNAGQMPPIESRAGIEPDHRGLSPVDVGLRTERKQNAGNLRHIARLESACQGVERSRDRAFPVESCSRTTSGRSQAAAFRLAWIGFD